MVEPLGHNPVVNLFRKLTPNRRTENEAPLTEKDINYIKREFKEAAEERFYLVSLLAFFFYFAFRSKRLFGVSQKLLHELDLMLFRRFPRLSKYSWYSLLILRK